MKSFFTRAGLTVALAAILSAVAFAQTTAPQGGTGDEGRHGRFGKMDKRGEHGERGGRRMGGRVLERLNLSETQRQQMRDIESRYGQNFKSQRQELRQLQDLRREGTTLTPDQQTRAEQLRNELRANGERMHNEILALLTTEQRDQLKQMHEELKSRREQRRERLGKPTNQ
jgi:Spy/CpxP family protein refolding chaperone